VTQNYRFWRISRAVDLLLRVVLRAVLSHGVAGAAAERRDHGSGSERRSAALCAVSRGLPSGMSNI